MKVIHIFVFDDDDDDFMATYSSLWGRLRDDFHVVAAKDLDPDKDLGEDAVVIAYTETRRASEAIRALSAPGRPAFDIAFLDRVCARKNQGDAVLTDEELEEFGLRRLLPSLGDLRECLPVVVTGRPHDYEDIKLAGSRKALWVNKGSGCDETLYSIIQSRISLIVENRRLRQGLASISHSAREDLADRGFPLKNLEGNAPEFLAALTRACRAMEPRNPQTCVLLMGETGTGKGMLARAVHDFATVKMERKDVFKAINCAGLSEGTLASELFGHKRGAFSGADRDHDGLFQAANGGTLFLDEVGEMSMGVQGSLLHALENRLIRRVGDTEDRKVDVFFIAATNADLAGAVKKGTFRKDLHMRLWRWPVELPPLRKRQDDILPLTQHFLAQACGADEAPEFTPEAAEVMLSYHWPGNVRQLMNVIERVRAGAGRRITREALLRELRYEDDAPGVPESGDEDPAQRLSESADFVNQCYRELEAGVLALQYGRSLAAYTDAKGEDVVRTCLSRARNIIGSWESIAVQWKVVSSIDVLNKGKAERETKKNECVSLAKKLGVKHKDLKIHKLREKIGEALAGKPLPDCCSISASERELQTYSAFRVLGSRIAKDTTSDRMDILEK